LKTYADVKKAQKDLRNEIIAGNKEAVKSLADLKDKLEDIGEETNTLKGSGVEKLTSSFSLLGQGFANFDTDKIKTGFKGIGAAMSAVPIFLFIEGIKLLVENFDVVIDVFNNFIGVQKDGEQQAARLTDEINRQVDSIKELQKANSDYTSTVILEQKALGASEEELANIQRSSLLRNKNAAEEALKAVTENYNAILRNIDATDEQFKNAQAAVSTANEAVKSSTKALNDFVLNEQINLNKKLDEEEKVLDAKQKERTEKLKALKAKEAQEDNALFSAALAEEQKALDEDAKLAADRQKVIQDQKIAGLKLIADTEKAYRDQAAKDALASAQKTIELEKYIANQKQQLGKSAFNTLQSLSATYFSNQLINAKGNAEAETKIRKKQFEVEKAFKIGNVVIDTAGNIVKTTAQLGGVGALTPSGIALLAGIAALGITQSAIIAAAKFDSSGGSSTAPSSNSIDLGGASSAPAPPPPQFSPTNQQQTILQSNGINGPIQAYVVETQSTGVSNRVRRIEENSTF